MSTGFLNSKLLHVQIGGCGNRFGCAYWTYLSAEHSINPRTGEYCGAYQHNDLSMAGSVFYEIMSRTECPLYRPAGICVDIESSDNMIEALSESGLMSALADRTVFLESSRDFCHSADDRFSIDKAMQAIRFDIERDDYIGGFQLFHSATGRFSRLCARSLLESLRAVYPKKVLVSACMIPGIDQSVLNQTATRGLLLSIADTCDGCFVYDNSALERIWTKTIGIGSVDLEDLNQLSAIHLTGLTAAQRLPGTLNKTIYSLVRNVSPRPRMPFFVPAIAPVYNPESRAYAKGDALELTRHLFNPSNMMISVKYPANLCHLAMSGVYRGTSASPWELRQEMFDILSRRKQSFRRSGFVYESAFVNATHYPQHLSMSASAIWCSSVIAELFKPKKDTNVVRGESGEYEEDMTQLAELYSIFKQ